MATTLASQGRHEGCMRLDPTTLADFPTGQGVWGPWGHHAEPVTLYSGLWEEGSKSGKAA